MKQIVSAGFLFLFICLFISAVGAEPKVRKVSVPNGSPLPKYSAALKKASERKTVKLRYQNKSFEYVLNDISKRTGIRFTYKAAAFDDRITTKIKAPDWPSALKQLLENYSRIEMWSSDLKESKIWIIEKLWDNYSPSATQYPRRVSAVKNKRKASPRILSSKSRPAPRPIIH